MGDLPGVRVILYDNRGHGRTSGIGDASRLTFPLMAEDMAALLDHLAVPAAAVGGVSMGAGISMAFCLKYPGPHQGSCAEQAGVAKLAGTRESENSPNDRRPR